MQSGNHLFVERAMSEAHSRLRAAAETLGTSGSPLETAAWYYGAVFVAVAAVAVVVAVVVAVFLPVAGAEEGSSLKHDEMIHSLALGLKK
jgi:hypothetical protein